MSKSINQVLGYLTLTGSIQATTSGIPRPLPDAFMKTSRKVIGDKGRYTRVTGERRTARIAKYGSPARAHQLRDVGEVDVKLLHTFESVQFNPLVFKQLRSKTALELDQALDEVSRQVSETRRIFDNLRVATTMQVLHKGTLYVDREGNLLPNSSGAIETYSFQMNANNQNQLNGLIPNSWALANTDIPLSIRKIKKQALRTTGYPLTHALYGENVVSYLVQNNYVLDWMVRNPAMRDRYAETGELPDGFLGIKKWIPVYEGFYEDQNGTNQDLWGADDVTFTPDPTEEWWEVLEGSFEVPTTLNVVSDAESAMRSTATVYGMFGYGALTLNPPTVWGYYGDTFLPVLRNPDTIYQSTVAF